MDGELPNNGDRMQRLVERVLKYERVIRAIRAMIRKNELDVDGTRMAELKDALDAADADKRNR